MPKQQRQIGIDPLDLFKNDFRSGGYPRLQKLPHDIQGTLIGVTEGLKNRQEGERVCLNEHACWFCGHSLQPGEYYFILNREEVESGKAHRPPVHIECAYYRLWTYPEKETNVTLQHTKEVYLIGANEFQFNPSKPIIELEYKNILMKLIYRYDSAQNKLVLL